MGNYQFIALANLAVCMTIVFVCLCRLNKMDGSVLVRVRSQYAVTLNCALACGWQPVWGDWPGVATLAMSAGVLFYMSINARNWTGGPPDNCYIPGAN